MGAGGVGKLVLRLVRVNVRKGNVVAWQISGIGDPRVELDD